MGAMYLFKKIAEVHHGWADCVRRWGCGEKFGSERYYLLL
jgi:hypothetical protein